MQTQRTGSDNDTRRERRRSVHSGRVELNPGIYQVFSHPDHGQVLASVDRVLPVLPAGLGEPDVQKGRKQAQTVAAGGHGTRRRRARRPGGLKEHGCAGILLCSHRYR